jgi:hypothetical protein
LIFINSNIKNLLINIIFKISIYILIEYLYKNNNIEFNMKIILYLKDIEELYNKLNLLIISKNYKKINKNIYLDRYFYLFEFIKKKNHSKLLIIYIYLNYLLDNESYQ